MFNSCAKTALQFLQHMLLSRIMLGSSVNAVLNRARGTDVSLATLRHLVLGFLCS